MKEALEEAVDQAARTTGATDASDYILRQLQRAGLRVRKDLSPAAKAALKSGEARNSLSDFSATSVECSEKYTELNAYVPYHEKDPEVLRAQIAKLEAFQHLSRETRIESFVFDIPAFLRALGSKCQELAKEQAKAHIPVETSLALQKLALTCQDTNALRQRLLRLFRAQGNLRASAEIRGLVEGLVDSVTFDLNAFVNPPAKRTSTSMTTPEQAVLDKLRDRYFALLQSPYGSCPYSYGSVYQVSSEAIKSLVRSRVFVEAMIDRVYTSERRARFERVFAKVKSEVKKVVPRITADPVKIKKINDRYDQLKLGWLKKPEEKFYKADSDSGLQVLDDDIVLSDPMLHSAVVQTGPEFFSTLNAFYTPQTKKGDVEVAATVNLMPMFIELSEQNMFTVIGVLSHEVGHQIGPMLSAINGFDLRSDWSPLLQCLAKPESIRLLKNQADEAMADFVSAEVTATLIGQLPERKRRAAGLATVADFCYFNAESMGNLRIDVDGVHPESVLRISGIYGGNGNYRKILGCRAESPSLRTCDLEHNR